MVPYSYPSRAVLELAADKLYDQQRLRASGHRRR